MQCGLFQAAVFPCGLSTEGLSYGTNQRGSTRSLKSIAKINIVHQQLALRIDIYQCHSAILFNKT